MGSSLRGLFIVAVLFGLIGLCLGYDGIARMKRHAVPPFNDGLYKAIWSIPPPPRQIVLFWNSLFGRFSNWFSLIAVPSAVAWFAFDMSRSSVVLILGAWSISTGFVGVWMWAFSLFT